MTKIELTLDFFPYLDTDGNISIDIFRGEEDVPCEKFTLRLSDIVKSEMEMHEIPGTDRYSPDGCEEMEKIGRRLMHQGRRLVNASKRVYEKNESYDFPASPSDLDD